MDMVNIIIGLALIQLAAFGLLVGRARGRYGVKAPATSGHEIFDRYFRVQMNTLELLVLFVPGMLLAPQYLAPLWVAAIGAVYLIGRLIYLRAYVSDPPSRGLGFGLSFIPVILLALIVIVGAALKMMRGG